MRCVLCDSDHNAEIEHLNRLIAEMVIARKEHATAIHTLRSEVRQLIVDNAQLRAEIAQLTHREDIAREINALPARVAEVEACIEGIEQHLRIQRRPKHLRT